MNKISIVIADDHKMVRDGIRQLLELDGNFNVISQVNDGVECIDVLKTKIPDILLLDINMPRMNGLEVLKYLKENKMKVKVIVLTIHNEVDYLLRAYDYGVKGYVLKDSELWVLRDAIYSVYNDGTYIQENLIPLLTEKLSTRDEEEDNTLTKRELEVLKLIAKGLYNKEIAAELNISEKTVKNHACSIFKKINVSDRTQAAVYAIKNNYIQI